MPDFTLNAPGTANNPWLAPGLVIPVSTIQSSISPNGWRAGASTFDAFAHDANYGPAITSTFTIISGGGSNGDQFYLGDVVRSGANKGAGFGILVDAFILAAGWWDVLGNFTKLTSSDTSITRGSTDVWSVTTVNSSGTATIGSVTQNGVTRALVGAPITTTQWTTEPSLAAGGGLTAGNNNSLYLSQFTGTGVLASNSASIAWVV